MNAPTRNRPPFAGRRIALAASLALLAAIGCNYSLAQGVLPDHVDTVAVLPFENETTRLELTQELYDVLSVELPRALGIQPAAPEVADMVIQGTITGYDLSTPNYRQGQGGDRAEVLQRQVNIVVSVELVDLVDNVILWDNTALRAEGQYLEQSQNEDDGKREALEILVQRIVDGAQSNW